MEVGGPTVTDYLQSYTKQNELKQIMNDFISDLLLHKPDNVFKFASDYFSTFHSSHQSQFQPTPVVIAGPSGVGKGTCMYCNHLHP